MSRFRLREAALAFAGRIGQVIGTLGDCTQTLGLANCLVKCGHNSAQDVGERVSNDPS